MLKIKILALLTATAVQGAVVPRHEDHSAQLPTTVPYAPVSATPVGPTSTGPILIIPVEPSKSKRSSGIISIVPVESSKSKSSSKIVSIVPVAPSSSRTPVVGSSAPPAGSSSKQSVVFVTKTSYVTVPPSVTPSSSSSPGDKTMTKTVFVTLTADTTVLPSSPTSGASSGASSMYFYGTSCAPYPSTNMTSGLSSSKKKLTKTLTVTKTEPKSADPLPIGSLPSNPGFVPTPGPSSAPASAKSSSVTKLPISPINPSSAAQPSSSAPKDKPLQASSGSKPAPASTGNMGGFNYPKPSGAQRRDAVTGLTVAAQATGLPADIENFPIVHSAKASLDRRAVPSGAFAPAAPNNGLGPNWLNTDGRTLTVSTVVTVDVPEPVRASSSLKKVTGTGSPSRRPSSAPATPSAKSSSKPAAKPSAAPKPSFSPKPPQTPSTLAPGPTTVVSKGKHCPYPYPGEECGGRKTTFAMKTRKSSSSNKPSTTKKDDEKPNEKGWCPYPGQDC